MTLRNSRILVVEDEYMLAMEIRNGLAEAGAIVVGPEPSVERALSRMSSEARIDAAVLDVNLGNEPVFPIADALAERGIPFVFASGYGEEVVSSRYPGTINCNKPLDMHALIHAIERTLLEP